MGAEALRAEAKPVPEPKQFKMLVDTGADTSVLDEDAAVAFGLPYVRGGWARTINGVRPAQRYEFVLTLFGQNGVAWTSGPIRVMARRDAFVGAPYAGLIGRDVLDGALFIYNAPAHHCTLAL
jgi:hypothetical protein